MNRSRLIEALRNADAAGDAAAARKLAETIRALDASRANSKPTDEVGIAEGFVHGMMRPVRGGGRC